MTEKKIRVGFAGAGGMGQAAHLRNYAINPRCEVVAVAELREKTGQAVARRYGIPRVYREASEMIAKEKLDAIVASHPFDRHGIVLSEILKARVPVFIEKPLAASLAVGEKLVAAVKAAGTFVMVGYHKRSDPATMWAKRRIGELAAGGDLGKLRYVRILMPEGDWAPFGFDGLVREDDPQPSLSRDPPAPDMDPGTFEKYTAFVNYYIHQVNLMRHLLGEPYRPVFADRAGVLLVGESDSGITCTIEMTPFRTTVDWQEQALVCFQKGWIRLELPAPLALNRPGKVEVYADPGEGVTPTLSSPTLPWVHAMKQQADNFISAVRGERPPMTTAEEALEDLRVARAYIRLFTGK